MVEEDKSCWRQETFEQQFVLRTKIQKRCVLHFMLLWAYTWWPVHATQYCIEVG